MARNLNLTQKLLAGHLDGDLPAPGEPIALHFDQSLTQDSAGTLVMLLLDKSYSMIEFQWDHDGDAGTPTVTRWDSLHTVVDALAHDVEDDMELGMVLFPSPAQLRARYERIMGFSLEASAGDWIEVLQGISS